MTIRSPTSPSHAAAHAYADQGLAVVPLHRQVQRGVCSCRKGAQCGTPGKHPRILWAERPAVPPTAAEIDRWFGMWSESRVGVILGDHHCALDVDEHGDEHGLDELHDLESTFGKLPDTWRALTPTDGLHIWFALAGELPATTHNLRPGVQLRAGRHVMAMPPSDGREWELSPDETLLAPLPGWVSQYVREASRSGDGSSSKLPLSERLKPNWRHDSYVAAARSMSRVGLPRDAIVAALEVTDRLLGDPPKNDRSELVDIASWAVKAQAADDQEWAGWEWAS